MSCGLTASTTSARAGDGVGVRERRLDAVAPAQLGGALLAPERSTIDLVRLAPAGS